MACRTHIMFMLLSYLLILTTSNGQLLHQWPSHPPATHPTHPPSYHSYVDNMKSSGRQPSCHELRSLWSMLTTSLSSSGSANLFPRPLSQPTYTSRYSTPVSSYMSPAPGAYHAGAHRAPNEGYSAPYDVEAQYRAALAMMSPGDEIEFQSDDGTITYGPQNNYGLKSVLPADDEKEVMEEEIREPGHLQSNEIPHISSYKNMQKPYEEDDDEQSNFISKMSGGVYDNRWSERRKKGRKRPLDDSKDRTLVNMREKMWPNRVQVPVMHSRQRKLNADRNAYTGEFKQSVAHCWHIGTRVCSSDADCQCYGLYSCNQQNNRCIPRSLLLARTSAAGEDTTEQGESGVEDRWHDNTLDTSQTHQYRIGYANSNH